MVMPECVDECDCEADGGVVADAETEEPLPELDADALEDVAARTWDVGECSQHRHSCRDGPTRTAVANKQAENTATRIVGGWERRSTL